MIENDDEKWRILRGLLDSEHEWPGNFLFKFIVPVGELQRVEAILGQSEISLKASKKGNYVSVTAHFFAESADSVIEIYMSASQISGVISL